MWEDLVVGLLPPAGGETGGKLVFFYLKLATKQSPWASFKTRAIRFRGMQKKTNDSDFWRSGWFLKRSACTLSAVVGMTWAGAVA